MGLGISSLASLLRLTGRWMAPINTSSARRVFGIKASVPLQLFRSLIGSSGARNVQCDNMEVSSMRYRRCSFVDSLSSLVWSVVNEEVGCGMWDVGC